MVCGLGSSIEVFFFLGEFFGHGERIAEGRGSVPALTRLQGSLSGRNAGGWVSDVLGPKMTFFHGFFAFQKRAEMRAELPQKEQNSTEFMKIIKTMERLKNNNFKEMRQFTTTSLPNSSSESLRT